MNKIFKIFVINSIILLLICNCSSYSEYRKIKNANYKNNSYIVYQSKTITRNGIDNKFTIYRCNYSYIPTEIDDSVYWKGIVDGEYLIIEIIGYVKKIEFISLDYEDSELYETGIINSISDINNGLIVINTYFTESWPNEKIRIWDLDGEKYEYEFNEKYLGGES